MGIIENITIFAFKTNSWEVELCGFWFTKEREKCKQNWAKLRLLDWNPQISTSHEFVYESPVPINRKISSNLPACHKVKNHKCSYCLMEFTQSGTLKAHVEAKHENM